MDYWDVVDVISKDWKKEKTRGNVDLGTFVNNYVNNMRWEEVLEYCNEVPRIRSEFIQLRGQKLWEELIADIESKEFRLK